jgi:CBS domain-containing protein
MRNVPVDQAGPTVADIMIPPETVTTAEEAQAVFESPRRHVVLMADADGTYLGTVTRDRAEPRRGTELSPTDSIEHATQTVRETGEDRIPVTDGDRLVGLVCFNLRRDVYCTLP